MQLKLKTFSIILFAFTILSCETDKIEDNVTTQKEIHLKNYELLSSKLKSDFSSISKSIRKSRSDFGNTDLVINTARKLYVNNPNELDIFNKAISQNQQKNAADSNLNNYLFNEVNLIINEASSFNNFESYASFLDVKFDEISNGEIDTQDKDYLLTYITVFKQTLLFIESNQDLFKSKISKIAEEDSWWDSWGQCAAAISGGAVTGATTLGLAGAAVGTVTLPVVGTVAAGTVGAVGGAIGGALTGAATGC